MKKNKRIFIIVLDSLGIGAMPDAAEFHDEGSNTLKAIAHSPAFDAPVLTKLGLFNIDGVDYGKKESNPMGSYARLLELSMGKDTTIGHWEIAGIVSKKPLPTYPDGFPIDVIQEFERCTGRKILCNKPYSGTDVIRDFGEEHIKTGALIVYTSADSVFQIAAHENIVPPEELYRYCRIAREVMSGEHAVGRIIARPFDGEYPFKRTSNRHDFSLPPAAVTMLDAVSSAGLDTIGVGKIKDIFAGKGIAESYTIKNNSDGMDITISLADKDFSGLCFVNRNDVAGYAAAVTSFDKQLEVFMERMRPDDVLMITADHGCDPSTPSTDHSREYVPLIIYGNHIKQGVNLGTRKGFCDIAATVQDYLGLKIITSGNSLLKEIFYA